MGAHRLKQMVFRKSKVLTTQRLGYNFQSIVYQIVFDRNMYTNVFIMENYSFVSASMFR